MRIWEKKSSRELEEEWREEAEKERGANICRVWRQRPEQAAMEKRRSKNDAVRHGLRMRTDIMQNRLKSQS